MAVCGFSIHLGNADSPQKHRSNTYRANNAFLVPAGSMNAFYSSNLAILFHFLVFTNNVAPGRFIFAGYRLQITSKKNLTSLGLLG